MATAYSGSFSQPGFTTQISTHEASILWQNMFYEQPAIALDNTIVSTAADSGNTPTSTLRAGLVMAKDANGLWTPYDADSLGVSSYARGVLGQTTSMLDGITGSNTNRQAIIYRAGGARVKAAGLVNLDYQSRWQLECQGFEFDDGPSRKTGWHQTKTADYQVLVADNGCVFNRYGDGDAINFTLPAIEVGLIYHFFSGADQNLVITSTEGNNIVTLNDLAATTATFSTSSNLIGAQATVRSVYKAASTLVWELIAPQGTVTAA